MKKQLKTLSLALLAVALFTWSVYAYDYVTSEKVYLKNSISDAKTQQEELAQSNSILREVLPEKQEAFNKAKQELEQVTRNIHANSTQWDFLQMEIQNKEFRLTVITEADKNIWNLGK